MQRSYFFIGAGNAQRTRNVQAGIIRLGPEGRVEFYQEEMCSKTRKKKEKKSETEKQTPNRLGENE
jgi:hypothetical protein